MYFIRGLIMISLFVFFACNTKHETANGCVVALIIAIENHDMTKAWSSLSREIQAYYNDLGEKQRRSGKGAFENEINKIKSFRSAKFDYKIQTDKDNSDIIKVVTIAGPEHRVETINENGGYKIKDEQSLKNLLDAITAQYDNTKTY